MSERHRILLAALLVVAVGAGAQERRTAHTFGSSDGQTPPPATLADMQWLAGHWVGEAFGGRAEEHWSAADGGAMVGWYRLIKNDKPEFYELMTIVEDRGSLVMRLRHFHADLTGWEEKDEVQAFPLVSIGDGAMHFDGMSFHPDGDRLTVYLAIEQKNGSIEEMKFEYTRR